jgi:hypothetical protein
MAPAVQELSQLESKTQLLYLKRHFGKETRNRNWIGSRFVEFNMFWNEVTKVEFFFEIKVIWCYIDTGQKVFGDLRSYGDEMEVATK